MNNLQTLLNKIKTDKDTNLLPTTLLDNIVCLGIEGSVSPLSKTDSATATSSDLLYPKTAYAKGELIMGNIMATYETGSVPSIATLGYKSSLFTGTIKDIDPVNNLVLTYVSVSSTQAVFYLYEIENNNVKTQTTITLTGTNVSKLLDAKLSLYMDGINYYMYAVLEVENGKSVPFSTL